MSRKSAGRTVALAVMCCGLASAAYAEGRFDKLDLAPKKEGTAAEMLDIKQFCGTKPIRVALADGFGGNAWRKITRAEFEDEASKCPNITEVRYTDAQGKTEKAISDIEGLAAQHFDVILTYPDGGVAVLRAMREATKAGAAVIPYMVGTSFPGVPGRDYLMVATEAVPPKGALAAKWIAKQLHGEGDVIALAGTPGNPTSAAYAQAWQAVWSQDKGIKVLAGPIDTDWTVGGGQRVMSALLAKFPQVDALTADGSGPAIGSVNAFLAAGRPLLPLVTEDQNAIGCMWQQYHASNPNFQLATFSARTWIVRLALRKAVAAVEGLNEPEPSIVDLPLFEDSADPAKQPKCDKNLPPDAVLSAHLTDAQLAKTFEK